jgi:hypothetical protein
MRTQLDRLIAAAQQPGITLQVLPFAAGPHPAMYGTFHVFRFPGQELPDIVCGENMTSAFYPGKPQDAAAYVHALDRILRPGRSRCPHREDTQRHPQGDLTCLISATECPQPI